MAPPRPPIWFDNDVLVRAFSATQPNASPDAIAKGLGYEAEIIALQQDFELLIVPSVRFEFMEAPVRAPPGQAQAREAFLNRMGIAEDRVWVGSIDRDVVWNWAQAGVRESIQLKDANHLAQVRASAGFRNIRNPVFLTNDGGVVMRGGRMSVRAIEFKPGQMQIRIDPADMRVPVPDVPPVSTTAMTAEDFLSAAKAGWKSGAKSLLSADFIVGMLAQLLLMYADIAAAKEALRTLQVKFLKEGFAKGVAAGVMGWTEEEVTSIMNRVTNFRLEGLADPAHILTLDVMFRAAETCENYAIGIGFYFSSSKTSQWKNEMRSIGIQILVKYGYYFGQDPQALFEYDFIEKLAWVLQPTTDAIVEPMIRET